MLIDANLVVSGSIAGTATAPTLTGQAVTATAVSTNTIDLTSTRDIGEGNELLKLRALLTASFATLTSLTIEAIVADDAALSTNVTVIGSSGPIPVAQLLIGERFSVELNPRLAGTARLGRRYLGARYTVVGTNASAGAVFAEFGTTVQDGLKNYPSGFAVL